MVRERNGKRSDISQSVATTAEGVTNFVTQLTGSAVQSRAVPKEEHYMLPEKVVKVIAPPLEKLGFALSEQPDKIRAFSRQWYHHRRVPVEGGYLALLYIRDRMIASNDYADQHSWIGFLFGSRGAKGLILVSDSREIDPSWQTMADTWVEMTPIEMVKFLLQTNIDVLNQDDIEGQVDLLGRWMELDRFQPTSQRATDLTIDDLKTDERNIDTIVEILADQAHNAPANLGAEGYMKDLIERTHWPQNWRRLRVNGLRGSPDSDARDLVNYALNQGIIPEQEGMTALGDLLAELKKDVGGEDAPKLDEIITDYSLLATD